tara:strand:- start:1318 stop:1440 length:123 start_codon:yes stop_codon:yes gene_type:complete
MSEYYTHLGIVDINPVFIKVPPEVLKKFRNIYKALIPYQL